MWTDLLTNNKGIKGMYGKTEPSLDNVDIVGVTVNPFYLGFRAVWYDLPNPLPKRWIEKGCNACAGHFDFRNHDDNENLTYSVTNFNIDTYVGMSISIDGEQGGKKHCVLKDASGTVCIEVYCDEIDLIMPRGCNKDDIDGIRF